jgi:hypothetical protein
VPARFGTEHGEKLLLEIDGQSGLGHGKKTPASRPRRVTRIGDFDRRRPVARSRNSRTVLIFIGPLQCP